MSELSQTRPLVMGVALHAYIVGHPYRLRHLKRALRHIATQRQAIWLTTPGAIARQWENLWDTVDARLGPYLAINVAVAFRKVI